MSEPFSGDLGTDSIRKHVRCVGMPEVVKANPGKREAGAKTADLGRKHGVSEATLYNWKAKYGGMDVSEAKRLKQLEDENAKLKKLLAEQMLDAAVVRAIAPGRPARYFASQS